MKNVSALKRVLPRKVPQNYRELYDVYRPQLTEAAVKHGIPVTEVLTRLRKRQVIEGFNVEAHVPDTFSWDEAVAFLGLTDGRWHDALKKARIPVHRGRRGSLPWSSVRPWAVRGGNGNGPAEPWDMEAVYWGSDILRVADFLDTNGLTRKTPECARLERAFRRRIGWFLSSIKTEKAKLSLVKRGPTVEEIVNRPLDIPEDSWPKDLPHDQQELVKMYGPYVFDQVRRVSTIKTEQELEEINQQVWLNIVQSDVLGKFMEAARTKLPRTLTLAEALEFLGITHKQWVNAVSYHNRTKVGFMPAPVKGTQFGKDALYLTADIQTLDESSFLKGRRSPTRQNPGVTGRGFKSYLAKAVQNHFKNMLRTRFRRHKERPLDPKVALTTDGSGLSHKAAVIEDSTSWEDHLTDSSYEPEMESLLDLALQLRRYGVDPNSDKGLLVLDHMTRGITLRQALKLEGRQLVMTA